jgi:hypothetical protein
MIPVYNVPPLITSFSHLFFTPSPMKLRSIFGAAEKKSASETVAQPVAMNCQHPANVQWSNFATRTLVGCIIVASLILGNFQDVQADDIRFNKDIRPVLSANCSACHGPDAKHRKADLRLDEEAGVRKAFGGGLAKSEGWRRILSTDKDEKMPPPDSHRELKTGQIELVKKWIEAGAQWEGHWSFIAPVKAKLPPVNTKSDIQNPIDAFILARLAEAGLNPNSEATKETLLRRVFMDLIGLPPSVKEIDRFLADKSSDAFEKVVDRLFASRHFGERMALVWMDAARYGDSSVFHADGPRDMWPWRDWVIRAYNSNKRFDKFTIEQLAGDLIPNATLEQKIATGFNRNNATTDEGGAIAEEYRVEYAVDRVKTTSMVWLGLSLECAQCHNHKYDPIPMQDYYRFFAYFNQASDPGMQTRRGNQTPVVDVISPENLAAAAILRGQIPSLEEQLKDRSSEVKDDYAKWLVEATKNADSKAFVPETPVVHMQLDESLVDVADPKRKAKAKGKALWEAGKFGKAFKAQGNNFIDLGHIADFERDAQFSYGCWIKTAGNGSGCPIAKMNDGKSYRGFDLHTAGGNVAVHLINSWPTNAIKVTTKAKLKKNQWQHVFVTYDGSSKASGIKIYIDGKVQPWNVNEDRLSASIKTKSPLYIGRRNPGSPFKGLVDEVRVYDRLLSSAEVQALAGSDPIGPLLAKKPTDRKPAETKILQDYYLKNVDKTYQVLTQQISKLKSEISAKEKPVSTVMVMGDVPKMRATFVLDRGQYASPLKNKSVQPGVLSALPALPKGAPQNRLGLAQWLVQKEHPLTARVAINRYWYMLFGTGLVKTLEDFGAQGEWPSHPELLDWLAVDFVEHGWDIKRTLKQMVMSSTYRQSARVRPELLKADPENRLLARGPRFRLQGEFIRDNALAASGLLVKTIGGPSVKPYQPPGLWSEVSLSGARFVQDKGEKLYRRSMYIYWKRSSPAPALTIFDAPSREKCTLRRSRTNTPLQALITLNDIQFVESARSLAQQAINSGAKSIEDQITYAYRAATGHRPKPIALETLKEAFNEEYEVFKADEERAKKLLSIGESKRDESINAATHAAMTIVSSMILNLDSTLTRG